MRVAFLIGLVLVSTVAAAKSRKQPKHEPGAIVFVIDRSGSMKGDKLDAAKQAVLAAVDALDPADRISLVVFDSVPNIVFKDMTRSRRGEVEKLLDTVGAGGGTNVLPGLQNALEILESTAHKHKHVVVLSDGAAPVDGIVELVRDMQKAKISVSAVGVQGADRNLLSLIADTGNGRLYLVEDLGALPKVFMKETLDALN